jgi:hypothetical protein
MERKEPRPVRRNKRARASGEPVGGLLGLGLDGQDGHRRLTKGDDFLLVGGSAETHERMQDLVVRMDERLKRSGRRFADLTKREFEDLARDSISYPCATLRIAAVAALVAGCTAPAREATLDPLFRAAPGEGSYPTPVREPPPPAEPPVPERCKHVFEPYGTHLAVDRLTGGPMLCAITICRKCGEIRHECAPPPRR